MDGEEGGRLRKDYSTTENETRKDSTSDNVSQALSLPPDVTLHTAFN